ncbi:MAG: tumor necrosis factor receptor-associated factor 6-like protein [Faunusvirus sp.]|jgi:hypothetical protein|uniref:Tumor necrosis factor receptor-associated factor 6-like protein n=1 Tax=Faunusvirus sp. TaxID=2487766 RepID=A0A3G5A182_9VIRU|nr:MAG: tumor necrosis factor receptor-associated factor 6-like protein [Faunusvirus sp.]
MSGFSSHHLVHEKILNTNMIFCSICIDIIKTPTEITNCGHVFCYKCICEMINTAQICPLCRADIEGTQISLAIERYIQGNEIRCYNDQCGKTMTIGNTDIHIQNECEYENKTCIYCAKSVIRREFAKHSDDCLELLLKGNVASDTTQYMCKFKKMLNCGFVSDKTLVDLHEHDDTYHRKLVVKFPKKSGNSYNVANTQVQLKISHDINKSYKWISELFTENKNDKLYIKHFVWGHDNTRRCIVDYVF